MTTIASRWQVLNKRIKTAAEAAGRPQNSVRLIAVSKTFPAEYVRQAYAAGQRAFGESYVQEALAKIDALRDLEIEWHFIGPIQSNKTRAIAEHFHWVHSVDRLKIAKRLSDARPPGMPRLEVCLQVDVSGEASKSGKAPEEALALAGEIAGLPRIHLRGLMGIPDPTMEPISQRIQLRALRELKETIVARGVALDTLSMGMTDDLEAAIAEGATLVRVGRAIFGERSQKGAPVQSD